MDTFSVPFECKSLDDAGHIEGIAAGIGNVDFGGDRIIPGAFTKTLAQRAGAPVPMLLHHDINRPVGAWAEFRESGDGLHVKGRIACDSRDGADAYALVRAQALRGLSVGYVPIRKAMAGGVRELHEIDLHEISLVSVGMNDRAAVTSVKSLACPGDFEDLFRERGFSGRQAKAAASAAWKSINDSKTKEAADAELAAFLSASAKRLGFGKGY